MSIASANPGVSGYKGPDEGELREADAVHEVIVLSLEEGCPRAPVLACRDALAAEGAQVDTVVAGSDAELDEVIAALDGPVRADGLTWPSDRGPRLVVAASAVGQLRAVLRRMVRRYAPPPSRRPADLATHRTIPDLPPIGILPLYGASLFDTDPADVVKSVLHGTPERLDLLRTDAGSVTLDGVLLGGEAAFAARVEVDDAVLATPDEPVAACVIGNGRRYADLDGLPMTPDANPSDGSVHVAVAVPVRVRRQVRIEVRRARGRAVSVTSVGEVPFLDDGVAGRLARKRSWWVERGSWAVFRS
jgi:hypothetical protein